MPRAPRVEYPGAVYHILARGNRREPIVFNDGDRELFVETLGEVCGKTGWEVFAWVLMDNHYHLAVRTPEANLVEGMTWFQNTFTRRINVRNKLWGHLFGGRYKSILVENEAMGGEGRWQEYLLALVDYIHLNPARAGIVDGLESSVMDYPWSSMAQGYGISPGKRPEWLIAGEGMNPFGEHDTVRGRRRLAERLDRWAGDELADSVGCEVNEGQSMQSTLRRGWYWGSEEFKEWVLDRFGKEAVARKNRDDRSSGLCRSYGEVEAEKLIKEACRHYGVGRSELEKRPNGDKRRASVAWAIWKRTTVSQSWIAEKLGMRTAANVSQTVRRFDQLSKRAMDLKEWEWKSQKSKDVD